MNKQVLPKQADHICRSSNTAQSSMHNDLIGSWNRRRFGFSRLKDQVVDKAVSMSSGLALVSSLSCSFATVFALVDFISSFAIAGD
jgi:hypothetical protein